MRERERRKKIFTDKDGEENFCFDCTAQKSEIFFLNVLMLLGVSGCLGALRLSTNNRRAKKAMNETAMLRVNLNVLVNVYEK